MRRVKDQTRRYKTCAPHCNLLTDSTQTKRKLSILSLIACCERPREVDRERSYKRPGLWSQFEWPVFNGEQRRKFAPRQSDVDFWGRLNATTQIICLYLHELCSTTGLHARAYVCVCVCETTTNENRLTRTVHFSLSIYQKARDSGRMMEQPRTWAFAKLNIMRRVNESFMNLAIRLINTTWVCPCACACEGCR